VTAAEPRIYIIGIGSDGLAGLTARARDLLAGADLVLGSDHTLALLPELTFALWRGTWTAVVGSM
jgi:precorrin-6B methylase 1